MTFEDFILLHQDDDPARLLLSKNQYPEVDVSLAVNTIESRRKLRKKVPGWYAVPGLVFPSPLSAEQCSSSASAEYKSALVSGLIGKGGKVADLTGGLGVDAAAFAGVSGEVLYNEMSAELADAVRKNFSLLGLGNVRFSCRAVEKSALESILGGFRPDLIFLDPARRDAFARKVFRLEDCSPDIVALQDELLSACRYVLVKISPLADISMALRTLRNISEIHIVESDGECKELLLLLDRGFTAGSPLVTVASLGKSADAANESAASAYGLRFKSLSFHLEEETAAAATFIECADILQKSAKGHEPDASGPEPQANSLGLKGLQLFEPGKALMKSGAFSLISARFGLLKLDRHTHLYVAEKIPGELRGLGKVYSIIDVAPLGRQSFRDFGRKYPQAEVTARNVPMTSDALRKKLGCASGGSVHIFCTTAASERILIATALQS